MKSCPICNSGAPQDVLLELAHVWVTAQPIAALPGYVCVVAKRHVDEPFDLAAPEGHEFWDALMSVAKAVREGTGAARINYEIHGNTIRHLHCHLFPRYPGDPFEGRPIDPRAPTFARSPDDLARLRTAIPREYRRRPSMNDEERAAWYRALPGKRVGSGLVFVNEEGDALLVKPAYKDGWEIPGGLVEIDESPRAAAAREVVEELGLPRPVGRLLVIDWTGPQPPRTEGLMYVFDGGVLGVDDLAQIRLPAEELLRFEFVASARLADYLPESMARRIAAALIARRDGATIDLEDGRRVG